MNKHAQNLLKTRADMLGTDDEQHYRDCHNAADEIVRLTSENRDMAKQLQEANEAIVRATATINSLMGAVSGRRDHG